MATAEVRCIWIVKVGYIKSTKPQKKMARISSGHFIITLFRYLSAGHIYGKLGIYTIVAVKKYPAYNYRL
jgi:hypothetical protein